MRHVTFSADQMPNPHAEKSCRTSTYQRLRVLFLVARLRRAALHSGQMFFLHGPYGPCALWKSPRYFDASMFALLLTARRNQIAERIRIFAIVKAPCKFVHVQRKIGLAHFVVAPNDSAFEQTPESLDCVCVGGPDYVFARAVSDNAMIHVATQQPIAGVLIGRDQFHVFGNCLANEAIECCGIGILDDLGDDHSLSGDCSDDGNLSLCASERSALAINCMHVVGLSANEGFIHFDDSSERHYVALHGSAPTLTHIPSGPVIVAGVLAIDDAMDLKSAHPFLRNKNEIGDAEPYDQRDLGIFKDCVSGDAEVVPVASATISIPAAPSVGFSSNGSDLFFPIAARAAHASPPALRNEKIAASLFSREASVESTQCFHA
jgi:hypothetical protein